MNKRNNVTIEVSLKVSTGPGYAMNTLAGASRSISGTFDLADAEEQMASLVQEAEAEIDKLLHHEMDAESAQEATENAECQPL